MSKYDEINKEFESYFKDRDIEIDDFGENFFAITAYEDLDRDDLIDIEEHIFGFGKPFLIDVSARTINNNPYVLLTYECNIGKDEKTDDELYQESEDYRIDQAIRSRKGD